MLIPLGTDRPIRRPSVVTPVLILLCVAVFVLQVRADSLGEGAAFNSRYWVVGGESFSFFRALTYAFLHGDFMHLAGNMLFLWVFGRPVEDRLGRFGFAAFYLAGAIASGLAHAWFETAPAIGASGAVSAVTGAFLVLFPRTRIRVIWFLILISVLMAPAWFFIGLQIAWNILAGATGTAENIAIIAHLAGYGFGFGVAFTLLATGVLPREPYDLFSISRHAKRRRDFKAAANLAPKGPRRPSAARQKLDERAQQLADRRAEVSAALSNDDLDAAARAYRLLVAEHAADRASVTLARNAQYRIGTHFASIGEEPMAMRAFDDFLGAYPKDAEAGQIRILLARLCTSIGATGRARRLLTEAVTTVRDSALRDLAERELAALGPAESPAESTTDSPSSTGQASRKGNHP